MIYLENGKLFVDMMIVYGVAAAVAAAVLVLFFRSKARKAPAAAAAAPAPVVKAETAPVAAFAAAVAPGSAGKLKLYNTPPKTAAMVMAIVADQLGKPLNELRFISIKEVN